MSRTSLDLAAAAAEIAENGFTIAKGLIPKDSLDEIFTEISAVFDVALKSVGRQDLCGKTASEKYLFLSADHPRLKSHCYDVLGMLNSVRRVSLSPDVVALARHLYDTPIVPDLTQVRADDKANAVFQPMHQELGQMSTLNLALWCPLVDINERSGGMFVVKGSHKRGLRKHYLMDHPGMKRKMAALCDDEFADDEQMRLIMNAGDALLFHPHLFHRTAGNESDQVRWTIVSRYNELSEIDYLRNPEASLRYPEFMGLSGQAKAS